MKPGQRPGRCTLATLYGGHRTAGSTLGCPKPAPCASGQQGAHRWSAGTLVRCGVAQQRDESCSVITPRMGMRLGRHISAESGRRAGSAKGGARMAQAQAGAKEWGKGVLHGRGGGSYESTEEATKDRCPKRRSQKNQTVLRMPSRGHQRGRKASPQPSQRQRLRGGVVRESGCNRS
jgi:hypothetical protein